MAEPLVRYRVRQGVSRSNYAEFAAISARIALRTIGRWVPEYATTEDEVRDLRTAFHGMGNAKPPAGPAGWLLTRRYLELLRAWQNTQPNSPERRAIGSAEARRFRRALPPAEGFQVLPLVTRLAMLDGSFPLRWARHWLPRLTRSG